jgi:hypothetical protein
LNAIDYPVHIQRTFERRWATRVATAKPRRSRTEGTDTCECGNVVGAPANPTTHDQETLINGGVPPAAVIWEKAADLSKPSGRRFECQK